MGSVMMPGKSGGAQVQVITAVTGSTSTTGKSISWSGLEFAPDYFMFCPQVYWSQSGFYADTCCVFGYGDMSKVTAGYQVGNQILIMGEYNGRSYITAALSGDTLRLTISSMTSVAFMWSQTYYLVAVKY